LSAFDIIPVQGSQGLRQFIDLPYRLYRSDPHWVPPLRIAQKEILDQRKHPFYKHAEMQCFIARSNGGILGRVAAIHDRNFNAFHREEAGFFGFFEAVEDREVAAGLLRAAASWLRKRGARVVRGPVNPSTNYECGLLVDGFTSPPQVMMTHNPPYYHDLIDHAGFRKAKDLYAYHLPVNDMSRERVERVAAKAVDLQGVQIRTIRMKDFEREVDLVWKIYNAAWSRNWGFVPVTREEFAVIARDMKTILDPELILVAEFKGNAVGFALALPDINVALRHANGRLLPLGLLRILYHKRFITSLRVAVLGVLKEYRTVGVAAGFYAELFQRATRRGYRDCEMSWILEDNTLMNRSIESVGGQRYKTYRIYEWNN